MKPVDPVAPDVFASIPIKTTMGKPAAIAPAEEVVCVMSRDHVPRGVFDRMDWLRAAQSARRSGKASRMFSRLHLRPISLGPLVE